MKYRTIFGLLALFWLAACGKDSPAAGPDDSAVETVASTEQLPRYDSQGVIVTLDGQILTLDHGGASAAGLKPGRDGFIVRLEDGRVLYADFPRAVPATLGVARQADGSDGFRAGLAESGATLVDLCTSDDPATEGSLELRATARARNGYLDLIDGTLRVRFAGCDARFAGVRQGDLELVVELPRR